MSNIPSDQEGLRLLTAFRQIEDPIARNIVIILTEAIARGSSIKLSRKALHDALKLETSLLN